MAAQGAYYARDYDRAVEEARKTLELEAGFPSALVILGKAYVQKGMVDESISTFKRRGALLESDPAYDYDLGYAYAVAGMRAESQALRMKELNR